MPHDGLIFQVFFSIVVLLILPVAAEARAVPEDPGAGFSLSLPPEGSGRIPDFRFSPFTDLGKNLGACFGGGNALLHLSALGATGFLILSGADTQVHNFFARHEGIGRFSNLGVYGGYLVPAVLGGGLLTYGLSRHSPRLAAAGSAVLQATLLAVAYSSLLKGVTGRPNPAPVIYPDLQASESFRFGLLRGGLHFGWPSGHMITNTAAVASLITFFRDKLPLKIAGGLYLGYMLYCVISHDRATMHWFSDAVAGTLMGWAIGSTVGRSFRDRWERLPENGDRPLGLAILPGGFSLTFSIEL